MNYDVSTESGKKVVLKELSETRFSNIITSLIPTVCVADGGIFDDSFRLNSLGNSWESSFINLLQHFKIKYKTQVNLYERKRLPDLSKYSTIAFATTGIRHNELKRIMNFDLSNLKTVVCLCDKSYSMIVRKAEELDINHYLFNGLLWDDYVEHGYENREFGKDFILDDILMTPY